MVESGFEPGAIRLHSLSPMIGTGWIGKAFDFGLVSSIQATGVMMEDLQALGTGWLGYLGRVGTVPLDSLGSAILRGSPFLLTHVCLCGAFLRSDAVLRNVY